MCASTRNLSAYTRATRRGLQRQQLAPARRHPCSTHPCRPRWERKHWSSESFCGSGFRCAFHLPLDASFPWCLLLKHRQVHAILEIYKISGSARTPAWVAKQQEKYYVQKFIHHTHVDDVNASTPSHNLLDDVNASTSSHNLWNECSRPSDHDNATSKTHQHYENIWSNFRTPLLCQNSRKPTQIYTKRFFGWFGSINNNFYSKNTFLLYACIKQRLTIKIQSRKSNCPRKSKHLQNHWVGTDTSLSDKTAWKILRAEIRTSHT